MYKLFRLDSPVMILLRKVADLLIVNILWMLCSLPIVTIGASTTALYYVCFKIVSDEETYITKTFFIEFKRNFKQATFVWVIFVLLAGFLTFDILLVTNMQMINSNIKMILQFILIVFAGIILEMFIYTFALQAYFENTIKNTMKNAIIFGFSYFGYTLIMIIFDITCTILGVIYCPIIVPALPVCFNAILLKKIFSKHLPKNKEVTENEL